MGGCLPDLRGLGLYHKVLTVLEAYARTQLYRFRAPKIGLYNQRLYTQDFTTLPDLQIENFTLYTLHPLLGLLLENVKFFPPCIRTLQPLLGLLLEVVKSFPALCQHFTTSFGTTLQGCKVLCCKVLFWQNSKIL